MHHLLYKESDDMVTRLEEVYRLFLSDIEDEDWLLVEEEVIEDLLLAYLEKATVDFDVCRKDLTINYDIQAAVERELNNVMNKYNADGAWSIVMDPNNGEILALSSKPDFNPSNYNNYKTNYLLFLVKRINKSKNETQTIAATM